MEWIIANLGTIVAALLLIAAVVWIVLSLVREKKAGRGGCGCGCENCALHGKCHGGR